MHRTHFRLIYYLLGLFTFAVLSCGKTNKFVFIPRENIVCVDANTDADARIDRFVGVSAQIPSYPPDLTGI